MRSIIEKLLKECINGGAKYADIRVEESDHVRIVIDNSAIETTSVGNDSGVGIRVLKDGSWGFAYGSLSDGKQLTKMALKSVVLTSKFKKEDVVLAETPVIEDMVTVSVKENPLDVSLEDKTKLSLEIDKTMNGNEEVKSTRVVYREKYQKIFFANSEGSFIETIIPYVMVGAYCTAKNSSGETLQAHASLGHVGGMEIFKNDPPESVGERALRDALEGIKAPKVKGGRYNVVMDGAMNGLFAHEAVGHASEGDFCRTAGVLRGKLGKKVAAKNVSLIDDGSILEVNGNRFFGYIPYDDEGVKTIRVEVISDGVLR
ncbi:MAG: TldD/PmbA family protein, partial [Candidatus Hodarchaeales archaeon]